MNTDRFKFRVWDKITKQYDNYSYLSSDGQLVTNDPDGMMYPADYGENLVIEQCTGLRDKNGKLIYEGDVVNAKRGPNIIERAVIQRGTSGAFRLVDGRRPVITVDETHDREIIGNIHNEIHAPGVAMNDVVVVNAKRYQTMEDALKKIATMEAGEYETEVECAHPTMVECYTCSEMQDIAREALEVIE